MGVLSASRGEQGDGRRARPRREQKSRVANRGARGAEHEEAPGSSVSLGEIEQRASRFGKRERAMRVRAEAKDAQREMDERLPSDMGASRVRQKAPNWCDHGRAARVYQEGRATTRASTVAGRS
jgi:hypothetical protein